MSTDRCHACPFPDPALGLRCKRSKETVNTADLLSRLGVCVVDLYPRARCKASYAAWPKATIRASWTRVDAFRSVSVAASAASSSGHP